jgi:hypothetical protein
MADMPNIRTIARPDPNAALTPDEFACLKELAVGKLRHDTSPACEDRLTQLCLIEEAIGDLTLTEAGAKRLAKGL